ncbi:MAG TPA: protein kinase, partial [Gemmataceae bacterium]|nr:protein kinase [Gemmataceae bacterium]
MNALQFDHPVYESLLAFAQGRLNDPDLARIEEHLRDCGACRRTVEAAADDTLIVLLRSAATDSEGVPPIDAEDTTNPPLPPALMQHSRYRVQESLGAGGMGTVYKAEHLLMGRTVALKVIHPALVARPGAVERFVREARAAARLSHPNIVTAYDAEQVGALHLLVMEHVEGVSLAHLVAAHGPLPITEACSAIRQAALGLQHAHERGMVHRDIKPHNLMRTPDGRVKVLDFGLANLVLESQPAQNEPAAFEGAGSLTHADTIVGTPDYIAPEQARAAHAADIRADIYSLGCTLYFLLTGRPPFPEGNTREKMQAHQDATPRPIRELRPEAPPALARVLDRLLAKDPEARYQTPAEVAQALAPFIKSRAKAARWSHWLGIAAAGVAAILLAGVIVRVQTNKGTIIIQAADKQIETLIDQAGGVTVIDEATQHRYHLRPGPQDLQSGQYHIEVSDHEAGLHFDTLTFTLTRGGQVRVTASFVPTKPVGGLDAEAFAWFPDDCRFFVGRNLRVHAGLSNEQLTILLQLLADAGWRERIWKLKSILGKVERITAAFAPEEKHPERGKIVIRITGRLNRQRLVDWFKTEFRDALEEGGANPTGTFTIFRNLQPLPVAAAVVNDTDLVIGGYIGGTQPPVEVVREVMRVRAGREPSAKPRYQVLTARV